MTNYDSYNTDDFLEDKFFIQWVRYQTPEAKEYWEKWIAKKPGNLEAMETARTQLSLIFSLNRIEPGIHEVDEVLDKISHAISKDHSKVIPIDRNRVRWMIAAASVILVLTVAGVYYYSKQPGQQQVAKTGDSKTIRNDIPPGGNKAMLTLSNGSTIVLDSANNGTLTQQGNTKIIKLDDGEVAYNTVNGNEEILYNTISTPKGGQYQIVLADGSKVWLNAASSLRFPTSFNGKERTVELKGEGYFEVAKNPSMPFNVTAGDMKVQVLGTHFNINAYNDEAAIRATLLEGSVHVQSSSNNQSTNLKPGQQAQLSTLNPQLSTYSDVDINGVMAWKEGFFDFRNMEEIAIMRQIARWYDVTVEYKQSSNKSRFGERISRNLNLSNVLNSLETSGVHFKMEGNKITVL